MSRFVPPRLVLCLALLGAVLTSLPLRAAEPVTITEFLADNDGGLRDEDGEASDWIELYNSSTGTVNLGGWFLTDDAAVLTKWVFPSTNVAPGGFVIVFASGKNRAVAGAPLHANFSLDAAGEYLALVKPDGVTLASAFPAGLEQFRNISYGMGQNVTVTPFVSSNAPVRVLVPVGGTLGTTWTATNFNDGSWIAGTNGVGYETSVSGFAVRNIKANVGVPDITAADAVLANPSQQTAVYAENSPVVNYLNTGSSANYAGDRTFPGFTINVDQDNFVVEAVATVTIPAAGNWTFGVNSDDGFRLTVGGFSVSFPSARGPSDTLGTFNFPAAGDYDLRLVFFEQGGGSSVELFAAQGSFTAWNSVNFRLVGDTAAGGLAVRSQAVGGGGGDPTYRPFLKTDLQGIMFNAYSSAYIRAPFQVANAAALTSLTLSIRYDDGFAAYLNGTLVATRNAPASPVWNSLALAGRPDTDAVVPESVNLTPYLGLLRTGSNMLALHGLNAALNSSDLLVLAELAEFRATATSNTYFATPTPGAVNLSSNLAFVADTRFSHDRGFYTNAFSLVITSATPGAVIRYTTNGTAPTSTEGFTYTGPIPIGRTVAIRAAAFRTGFQPSNVDTHTYVFVEDVTRQQPAGEAPWFEWPAPSTGGGPQIYDYGMDPDIVNNPAWSNDVRAALRSLPTFSLVTSLSNLFNGANGIYQNPGGEGPAWERPASLELIHPDGSRGFHINCGVRLRGGFSRSTDNPKHAFRFFFREDYGAAKLKYRLFPDDPTAAEEFDKIDLRTFQNYSWSFGGDPGGTFMRDQLSRDMQLAMNHTGERGNYCHLYVNGVYWGIYNTDERPESGYAASYFGGVSEDYDVVKIDPQLGYVVEATDGNLDAWFRLWQQATNGFASDANYQRVQGNHPDGTRNPAYENLLDVPSLIDYMLVILHGGNLDAPISAFLGNTSPNNWYGSRNRRDLGGFRFFAHDSEHTMLNVNEDRTGPFPSGDPVTGGGFPKSNPQYLWQQLQANAEFRLAVADRVQRHYFNGGACTTSNFIARFQTRSNQLYHSVVAESARWGDSKRPTAPLTRNDWLAAANGAMGWILARNSVLLSQLRADGLWPTLLAPSFSQHGGGVPAGYALTITHPNPSGQILYTLDGTDPRLAGGGLNPTALSYASPIGISQFRFVRARVRDGATWSPLVEAGFYPDQDFTPLRLTEVMYNPPPSGATPGDALEFIEFKNTGAAAIDLSGCRFTNGVTFQFTNGAAVAPGAFVVLASDPAAFALKYPGVPVAGDLSGQLNNGGETLELVSLLGAPILKFTWNDRAPWPIAPDNGNFSLVPLNPAGATDDNDPLQWRASANPGGSPGADDPPRTLAPLLITEVLTHTDLPQVDFIEVRNPTATNVAIGGWYLTDDPGVPRKFRIPNGTVLNAGAYRVFTEADFNPTPGTNNSFSLSSEGDEVYLLSGDASTNLTGYSHGFTFGAAANGVTFGRYVNSVGEEQFPAQISVTSNAPNAGPRVGPVVLNEIHYHPGLDGDEFIELRNLTPTNVPLYLAAFPTNTWRLAGLNYSLPEGTVLAANGHLLLVATNPAVFRAKYSIPAAIPILGPYAGQLQDSGELLQLQRPDNPGTNGTPYITVDAVRYNDKLPWPVGADGAGPSLQRLVAGAYGNDPTNWFASGITPGTANVFNAAPAVALTAPADNSTYVPPASVLFAATASDVDGTVRRVEFLANGVSIGFRTNAPFNVTWTNAPPGTYSVTALATDEDGAVGVSAPITVVIFSPVPVTVVGRGSAWRYLDTGVAPAANWTQAGFNDGAWLSGNSQLGYGDGDEATVVGFGPDSANKYITTWFRRSFTVNNAARFLSLDVNVLRDDGCVVYLNGVEVFRSNLPVGPITPATLAPVAIGGAEETSVFVGTNLNPALLLNGTNILAVELHQNAAGSSDLSFDLELTGTLGPVAPAVNITSPTNNAVFTTPANIAIDAVAGDIDGVVVRLDFYAGTQLLGSDTNEPFGLAWNAVPAGDYALRAVAVNSGGLRTTSAPVNIRVVTNTAPAVALTSPVQLQVFHSPASLALAAQASDEEGTVTLVRFLANGTLVGQASAPPYTATWNAPPPGVHTLAAVATDNQNASRTSAVVHVVVTSLATVPATFLPSNSVWKYLDTGIDPGPAWRQTNFNDASWLSGAAELGYGDGGEATVVSFGPDAGNKYITTWFRRALVLTNAPQVATLLVRLIRDDGAAVYLNGVEVLRTNLPAGSLAFNTLAPVAIGGVDESTWLSAAAPPGLLVNGTNLVAVEMHQNAGNSSDLSFNLELSGTVNPAYDGDFDDDGLPDAWELAYGLNPNVPDAALDSDGDGLTNGQEFQAGTDPRDGQSYLRMESISGGGGSVTLRFLAVSNRTYTILTRPLAPSGPWTRLVDLPLRPTNRLEVIVDNAAGGLQKYYRLVTPSQP